MAEVEEIASTLEDLRARMVELVVRGLASVAPADLSTLEVLTDGYERHGLTHITTRLRTMLRAITGDTKAAPAALLSAYTSLHVFERVLSLEVAATAWQQAIASREDEEDGETERAARSNSTARRSGHQHAARRTEAARRVAGRADPRGRGPASAPA